jgi:hypothetical protein
MNFRTADVQVKTATGYKIKALFKKNSCKLNSNVSHYMVSLASN